MSNRTNGISTTQSVPIAAPVAGRRTPVEGAEENVGETLRHNFLPSLGGLDQL